MGGLAVGAETGAEGDDDTSTSVEGDDDTSTSVEGDDDVDGDDDELNGEEGGDDVSISAEGDDDLSNSADGEVDDSLSGPEMSDGGLEFVEEGVGAKVTHFAPNKTISFPPETRVQIWLGRGTIKFIIFKLHDSSRRRPEFPVEAS